MNDQVLFEVAKYIEDIKSFNSNKRLSEALNSKEVRKIRFMYLRKIIEKKMTKRKDIDYLKNKNIYKEEYHKTDFENIHEKLRYYINRKSPVRYSFSAAKISPKLASIAKNLDFELKKKLLARVFLGGPKLDL